MNRLRVLFSGIIAARVITGDRRGGFEHYLAKLVPSFRIGKTNAVRKHSQARESARRLRQHENAGHVFSTRYNCWVKLFGLRFNKPFIAPCESALPPHPHSAKFPVGTKQPLPQRRGWRWKPYYQNPKHEPVGIIIDEATSLERVWLLSGHQSGKTQERKIVYSGIKWRHLNER